MAMVKYVLVSNSKTYGESYNMETMLKKQVVLQNLGIDTNILTFTVKTNEIREEWE